jgi:uncharacterized protein YjbJ (UPF0337 family)
MGFLDKLFGRAKHTAGDVADEAAPVVDETRDSAAHAWDKATEVAGDAADEVKDTVSELTDRGEDAADAAEPGPETTGSSPTAA